MTLGTHTRVGQDLCDGIFCCRRLFEFVRPTESLDVVHRVVVGNVLQRIGDAVDDILLLDRAHGAALSGVTLHFNRGHDDPGSRVASVSRRRGMLRSGTLPKHNPYPARAHRRDQASRVSTSVRR